MGGTMKLEHLENQIANALREYDAFVNSVSPTKSNAQVNALLIQQAHYSAYELLKLAVSIRESVPLRKTKGWRIVQGIHDDMLSVGQAHSRALFSYNLRDSITDHIEHAYGVSFSALGIYPEWIDTTDGKSVFALYYHPEWNRGESMTLCKDGVVYFGENSEYGTRYIAKTYDSI
jgi:hypothetical protein